MKKSRNNWKLAGSDEDLHRSSEMYFLLFGAYRANLHGHFFAAPESGSWRNVSVFGYYGGVIIFTTHRPPLPNFQWKACKLAKYRAERAVYAFSRKVTGRNQLSKWYMLIDLVSLRMKSNSQSSPKPLHPNRWTLSQMTHCKKCCKYHDIYWAKLSKALYLMSTL